MFIFNKIVYNTTEPRNTSDIWFDGKKFYIYKQGEWQSVSPDWNAKEGNVGYIENKPFGDERIKLEWYYDDDYGAYVAKSQTDTVIINGIEYLIPDYNLSDNYILDIEINNIGFGFTYIYDKNLIVAFGTYEENIDLITNNVLVGSIIQLDEKYIPDTIARKSETITSDWNAQEGEVGYIKNKPFKVNSDWALDINSYHTIINDESMPIYVYLETGCGKNTLVKCEKNSEEGTFDWYKFEVTKDRQGLPYYVETNGTLWEGDDKIWNGSYIVDGSNVEATFIQTDYIENYANRIIGDYTLEDGILHTIPDTYIPNAIARKKYVDEKVDAFAENVLGPTAANLHERLSVLEESSGLISIIREDLPIINIDVGGWVNNTMSFAQVGITDKHINKWILLSSLKVTEIDSYGIEPQNTGDYFRSRNDVSGGVLSFRFDVDEGNVGIDFDLLQKLVYVHNDWE